MEHQQRNESALNAWAGQRVGLLDPVTEPGRAIAPGSQSWVDPGKIKLLLVVLLIAGAGIFYLTRVASVPIRAVRVEGAFNHLSKVELTRLLDHTVSHGFFRVDVAAIKARLLQHPWVLDVRVARLLPGELRVTVIEQVPIAQWGELGFINELGEVFAVERDPELVTLPRFDGPPDSAALMLDRYRGLVAILSPLHLAVSRLALDGRGAWRLALHNGPEVIVGSQYFDARMQRFLSAYTLALRDQWRRLESIDLRYTNGFAVRMKARPQAALK